MVVTFLLGFTAATRHDAAVNRTELAIPPSVTVKTVKGFSHGGADHEWADRRNHRSRHDESLAVKALAP
jgi:hypothetical protein